MTSLVGVGLVVPVPVLVVQSCTCTGGATGCSSGAGSVAGTTGGVCTGGFCGVDGPPSAMVAYICSLT